MIKTVLHGSGRMARRVLAQLSQNTGFELLGIVARTQLDEPGAVACYPSFSVFNAPADLLIDFTLPAGTVAAAQWCAANGTALLSGTTGLSDADRQALQATGRQVAVLSAPNLSYGVGIMMSLVRQAAAALGDQASVTITDVHHQHKVDAPSGTALALAAAVSKGRSEGCGQSSAGGPQPWLADAAEEPVFNSIREGEVIGEHTVAYTCAGELIEITHKALDRDVFAAGALMAGAWLVQQPPGFYSTTDWLG